MRSNRFNILCYKRNLPHVFSFNWLKPIKFVYQYVTLLKQKQNVNNYWGSVKEQDTFFTIFFGLKNPKLDLYLYRRA